MTHLKTTRARKGFIYSQVAKASPSEVKRIYSNVEKVTKFYKKRR